jgi:hypothetical protein
MNAVNVERIGFGLFSFMRKEKAKAKEDIIAEGAASEIDGSIIASQSIDMASFNVLM